MELNSSLANVRCFKREVRYLGRIVSTEGSKRDLADTAAVRALKEKRPSTVGQLRAVLGLLSYYRQYIQDFSKIAGPLYDLLKGAAETKEEGRKVAASKWIKSKKEEYLLRSPFYGWNIISRGWIN